MTAQDKMREQEERRRIGRRLRRRRLFLGLTQTALARALGVTFQQIQKYENGANRLPPRRLGQIAHHLDVAPDYFARPGPEDADAFENFVQSPDGIALYRANAQIPDGQARARLILAVAAFSDSSVRPEENDAGLLTQWLKRIAAAGDPGRHGKSAAAAIRAMKIELAQLIGKTLKARKLTQKFAAHILSTDQARISALARGNVEAASFEKLLRYMVLLGWDAHIAIAKRPAHAGGKIELTSGH